MGENVVLQDRTLVHQLGEPEGPLSRPFPQTILISKLDHIGDFVLGLSAYKRIRDEFASAEITLLCGSWNRTIAENSGIFDRVVCYDLLPETSGNYDPNVRFDEDEFRGLNLQGFDVAIDFRDCFETRFLLDKVEARWRAGFAADGVMHHMDMAFPSASFRLKADEKVHHSTLQELLACAVIAKLQEDRRIKSILSTVAKSEVGSPVPRLGSGPIVGINPGSGVTGKNWPLENFSWLANLLIQSLDATVVLFGSHQQIELCAKLSRDLDAKRLINLTGKLRINQFISTVGELDLYVGNDTGTTHISAALDIPTLCLFSCHTSVLSHGARGANSMCVLALDEGNAKSIPLRDAAKAALRLLSPKEATEKTLPSPHAGATGNLIVIDNKTYGEDFRKHLLREAQSDGFSAVHLRAWSDHRITVNGELFEIFDGPVPGWLIADRLFNELGDKPTIVMVGLGSSVDLAELVWNLKSKFQKCVVFYDVFDYFRYGAKGDVFKERKQVDALWRKVSDFLLLLDEGLRAKYWLRERKQRLVAFNNASHLQPLKRSDGNGRLVYIGSIDERVDFQLLSRLAAHGGALHIYGRVHKGDPQVCEQLEILLGEQPQVVFKGAYDNDELPEILRHYDIGIIPYHVRSSMTAHVNPDKLYHYLNAGLEVVATPIPQVKRLAKYVHLVRDEGDINLALKGAATVKKASEWPWTSFTWRTRWNELKRLAG